MRFLAALLFLIAFAFSVSAKSNAGSKWNPLSIQQEIIGGVSTTNSSTFYAVAEDSNANKYGFYSTNGGKTMLSLELESQALFLMGIAMQGQNGVTTGLSLLKPANSYTTNGFSFKLSQETGVTQESVQSIQTIPSIPNNLGFGLAGQFNTINGVGISTNGGQSWQHFGCQSLSSARYAAFPGTNTWFVTAGQWPNQSVSIDEKGYFHASKRVQVKTSHQGPILRPTVAPTPEALASGIKPPGINDWFTQVMKTTDGGNTWTSVFYSNQYYPNDIRCASELVCFFLAENDNYGYIFGTKDGGNTWQQLVADPTGSLLTASLTPSGGFWAGGSNGQAGSARSWFSGNNGTTWTHNDVGAGSGSFFAMSMADGDQYGYASIIMQSQYSQMFAYHP